MSNSYETHALTHDDKNPDCNWCQVRLVQVGTSLDNGRPIPIMRPAGQVSVKDGGLMPDLEDSDQAAEDTVNVEPSWINLGEMAIRFLQDSDEGAIRAGKVIIRDMAEKLARVRAAQPDCPEHLRNVGSDL